MSKMFMYFMSSLLFVIPVVHPQEHDKTLLYSVEKDAFQLSEGKTIYITDKHILLAFRKGKHCLEIVLNGRRQCIDAGNHFDLLKKHSRKFKTRKVLSDKSSCFLDVVRIDAPKGADAVATFRLHCI